MIQITNLSKWYGDFQVLSEINETVGRGQTVVLCGPSGSGKSTLLRCINGLESFQRGEILVDGLPVAHPTTNLYKLRRKIGMVFQRFELYPHMTVMDMITLAPIKVKKKSRRDAETKAMELLERVGIPDKARAYPANLSGGQQQRVAIARALANKPAILLADEPTANLDTESANQIVELFRELNNKGQTIVMVTHEPELGEKADRIVRIKDGRVVA